MCFVNVHAGCYVIDERVPLFQKFKQCPPLLGAHLYPSKWARHKFKQRHYCVKKSSFPDMSVDPWRNGTVTTPGGRGGRGSYDPGSFAKNQILIFLVNQKIRSLILCKWPWIIWPCQVISVLKVSTSHDVWAETWPDGIAMHPGPYDPSIFAKSESPDFMVVKKSEEVWTFRK